MTGPRRTRREDGSVLMLVPAAVVIVLLLGAVAVDSAIVYLEQRQAYNVAFDAANDAAGAGVDRDEVRRTGAATYDPGRVRAIASETIEASAVEGLELVDAAPDGTGAIAVTVEVRVRRLLGTAFGRAPSETLRITARAAAERRTTDP